MQNNTPTLSGAITLTMVFDATLNFVSSIPATTVSGNTITWNLPQLAGWQHSGASVQFTVPADPGLIGTQLLNAIAVGSVNADGDPANNSASASTTVTGSYDPNDKVARTSTGASNTLYFINEDEWIDYTIRFQNTGICYRHVGGDARSIHAAGRRRVASVHVGVARCGYIEVPFPEHPAFG